MSHELSDANETFIEQQVAIGTFRDRSEAIEAGVEMLRRQKLLVDRLAESQRQARDGEYQDFDEEGLNLLFEHLKERATGSA
jgi:Arc/MetJ-type ribon-helix-helix transcriptional regulator